MFLMNRECNISPISFPGLTLKIEAIREVVSLNLYSGRCREIFPRKTILPETGVSYRIAHLFNHGRECSVILKACDYRYILCEKSYRPFQLRVHSTVRAEAYRDRPQPCETPQQGLPAGQQQGRLSRVASPGNFIDSGGHALIE